MEAKFKTLDDIAIKYELTLTNNDIKDSSEILEIYNSENPEININLDNVNILNWISLYYKNIKNYEKMKKYYLIAIEKENSDAMTNLGIYYYFIEKNHKEAIKYYSMAIEKGNSNAMLRLGCYCELIEDYEEMTKYFLMAIEKDNSNAMYSLGSHYEDIQNYEEMKKYYLMAIEKDNLDAMTNYACYYEDIEDYEEMKKYYLMAIEKGNSNAMFKLGYYYENIKDYQEMTKYYLMAIEKENSNAMFKLGYYYRNNILKFFNLLFNLEKKSDIVINKINYLSKNIDVDNYIKKLNTNINNIKDCIVCYEKIQHIQFDCGHEICINCYCSMNNCYYKCK